MARLFSSGFELQSATTGIEWQTVTGSPSISTTTKRGGSAALRCNPTAATAYVSQTFQADTINTIYRRFAVYIGTLPSATTAIWQYLDSGIGVGFSLRMTSTGALQPFNESGLGTAIATSSALSTGAWHVIQIKIVDDATTAAVMEVYIDNVLLGTYTGLTGINGGGRDRIGFITSGTGDLYFDDYAVNNTTGTSETGYPAWDAQIAHMRPNAAGANNAWATAVGGTAGAANNYTRVNEVTPDDATSYNETSTGSLQDEFKLDTSSVPSGSTIKLVAIGHRGGSNATTGTHSYNLTIRSAAAGTQLSTGAAITMSVNGWTTHAKASPFIYQLHAYTDPTTAAAWTLTGTNSLANAQIGYKTAASAGLVRVTNIWALVEYVPGTTPTGAATISGDSTITAAGNYARRGAATISGDATQTAAGAPTVDAFIDPFTGTSLTGRWSGSYGNYAVSGGVLTLTSNTGAALYNGIISTNLYRLTGASIYAKLGTISSFGQASSEFYPILLTYNRDTQNEMFWYIESTSNGNHIVAYKRVGGTQTNLRGDVLFDPAVHKAFRIRESAGTIYFDWSTDCVSWTNYTSFATPGTWNLDLMEVQTLMGNYAVEATQYTMTIEGFNTNQNTQTGAATISGDSTITAAGEVIKTTLFTDNFNDNSLDLSIWDNSLIAGAGSETGGRYVLTLPANTVGYYTLQSKFRYNLIGQAMSAQIASISAMQSYGESVIFVGNDDNNKVWFSIGNNFMQAWKRVGGTAASIGTGVTFNPATMRFFRIREASGTTYFEYAYDYAGSWTQLASIANPIDMTRVMMALQVGAWDVLSPGHVTSFDNVNMAPPSQNGAFLQSGDSSLTVAGVRVKLGASTISGDATITAAGARKFIGAASVSGDSAVTAGGSKIVGGTATLSGDSTLTAAALYARVGAAALQGGSVLTVAGQRTAATGATLVGGGSILTVSAVVSWFDDGEFSGDSTLTVTAKRTAVTDATLSGDSRLTVAGVVIQAAQPRLVGDSTMTIDDAGIVIKYSDLEKQVMYKVYSQANVLLNTWNPRQDVISAPSLKEQINAAGSEVVITLARPADSYGEGSDIAHENRIELWVADKDAPNGVCMFTGRITKYKPNYNNETVDVTLLGYGSHMSLFIIEGAGTPATTTVAYNSYDPSDIARSLVDKLTAAGGKVTYIPRTFQTITNLFIDPTVTINDSASTGGWSTVGGVSGEGRTLDTTQFQESAQSAKFTNAATAVGGFFSKYFQTISGLVVGHTYNLSMYLYSPTARTIGFSVDTTVATTQNNSVTSTWTRFSMTFVATATSHVIQLNSTTGASATWNVDAMQLTDGATLYPFFSGASTSTTTDTYAWTGTANASTSTDVKLISDGSIRQSNTVVSYTFNANTFKEGIDKVLELMPQGWYYWIDQSTYPATLYFDQRGDVPNHTFNIGTHITSLDIEKSVETIVNRIYFVGGDLGGGVLLYKRYDNLASQATYGIRAVKISDGRVTQETTADIIANRSMIGNPQILVNLGIGDNGIERRLGYDIESVKLGQMVKIGNTGQSSSSKYDLAIFDTSPYDYDGANIGTIQFQVTEKDYTLEQLTMSLSTTPPDVTKRIADIKRNVDDVTYADTPATPTV
jgi:hypothetical protein